MAFNFPAKQDVLVSGTNIKTINGLSLLGSGNISTATSFPLLAPNGSVSAPSYSFTNTTNTGIWWDTTSNGNIKISHNGVTQLTIGGSTIIARDILQCTTFIATSSALLSCGMGNASFTENLTSSTDQVAPSPSGTRSFSIGRGTYDFSRPVTVDATRRLRVGKKINNTQHYGGTLAVVLPDTYAIGNTLASSSGVTLNFDNINQQQVIPLVATGDIIALAGLGQAKVLTVTSVGGNRVVTLDTDLGGAAVANKAATLIQDLASFRLADGSEQIKIDYNGALVVNESGADNDTRIEGDTDVNLLFVDAGTDRVGIGNNSPAVKLHAQNTTAATNTVTNILRVDSQSSGTPAAGIGAGIEMAAETAAGNTEVGVVLEAVTNDVTAASEDFDFVVKTMSGGAAAAERMKVGSNGNVTVANGDLTLNTAGNGLNIKEGTNARLGVTGAFPATNPNTVTVSTTEVTASSRIFLTIQDYAGAHPCVVYVSAVTAGTSFVITAVDNNFAGTVAWMIVEPA